MKELEIAESLLQKVLEDNTPFLDVLKDTFKTHVELRPYRGNVAGLLGCELRHHILMEYLCKPLEGLTDQQRRFIYLGLANNYYFKRFDVAEVKAFVLAQVGEGHADEVKALFEKAEEGKEIIPEEIDKNSHLYMSLRYNAPEWAIKVLLHYSQPLTLRILRKFARPMASTLRLRTSIAGVHTLEGNADFVPTKVDCIYAYQGHQSLRKNELYRAGKLFLEKMLIKQIIDENLVSEPSEILLFNGNDDSALEMELIETYGHRIGMNFATTNVDTKIEVSKVIKSEKLSNINFFSADDPLFMEADISRPQNLVLAFPDSTNFDKIPETPDYLFTLIKQNEYFPFGEYETCAYIAVMEKVEEVATAPSPLTDLSPIPANPTITASASSK